MNSYLRRLNERKSKARRRYLEQRSVEVLVIYQQLKFCERTLSLVFGPTKLDYNRGWVCWHNRSWKLYDLFKYCSNLEAQIYVQQESLTPEDES